MIYYSVLLCGKFKDGNAERVFDRITLEKDSDTSFDITTLISTEDESKIKDIIYYFIFKNEIGVDGKRSGKCVGAKLIEESTENKRSINRVSGFPVSDISFDSSGEYVVEVYRYNEIPFEKDNTMEDYHMILKEGEKVAKFNFNVEIIVKK